MYILGYSGFTRNSRMNGYRSPYAKTNQNFNNIFEFRENEVPFSMFPLGYFGHDASAALLSDGKVVACVSEERFTRLKYSLNLAGNTLLPRNAINYCLEKAGISANDLGMVAHFCDFNENNIQKRLELMKPFLSEDNKVKVKNSFESIYKNMMDAEIVKDQFTKMTGSTPEKFVNVQHHLAHAASAFFPSGFRESLILTLDGTGETESSFIGIGCGNKITPLDTINIPTSLGTLYLIITVYLGFKTLGDEYKVMGLASYGDPQKYRNVFSTLIELSGNGRYRTPLLATADLKQFLLENLGPERKQSDKFEVRHADIAASLQECLNNAALHTVEYYRNKTGLENLCMAGGVALNCTMNGVIARSGLFKKIFIQPAANDEGCSAGAALYAYSLNGMNGDNNTEWEHVYWGPEYNDEQIFSTLKKFNDTVTWKKEKDITQLIAQQLASGKVCGWFQGKMEFGPRALGNRSILADPRAAEMKDIINEKVKRRESFRPFAPAILEEYAGDYFDMTGLSNSPFMLFTVYVKENMRNLIPAVTHVDGTSRIQTVSNKTNKKFWELINEFKKITGIPVVLNTSYNVKNEPIVCSPEDAVKCFLSTNIDCIAVGDYYIEKNHYE